MLQAMHILCTTSVATKEHWPTTVQHAFRFNSCAVISNSCTYPPSDASSLDLMMLTCSFLGKASLHSRQIANAKAARKDVDPTTATTNSTPSQETLATKDLARHRCTILTILSNGLTYYELTQIHTTEIGKRCWTLTSNRFENVCLR